MNINYSPILHRCMNTRRGKSKFKNFWILLDSVCSSLIAMVRLIKKLKTKEGTVMQWHTQAGNIATNLKVNIYFTLPKFSATEILTWECHMGEYTKGKYDMILGRYILKALKLNIKLS